MYKIFVEININNWVEYETDSYELTDILLKINNLGVSKNKTTFIPLTSINLFSITEIED